MKVRTFYLAARRIGVIVASVVLAMEAGLSFGQDSAALERFQSEVQPLLEEYCFACHGYGSAEGNLTLDADPAAGDFLADTRRWTAVLKNIRSGMMPPSDVPTPSEAEIQQIAAWIKHDALGIDPDRIDPGQATVRRLSRYEYGNVVQDLMGIDFNAAVEFPPDDTGSGFDNVGEALTLSPMLLEKYLHAAQMIVDDAVPAVTWVQAFQEIRGEDFKAENGRQRARRLSFDQEANVSHTVQIGEPGEYRVVVEAMIDGSFEFHSRQCDVAFSIDGEQVHTDRYLWKERFPIKIESKQTWAAGEHVLAFSLTPLPMEEVVAEDDPFLNEDTSANFQVFSVRIEGPLDVPRFQHPPKYRRFFPREDPPTGQAERREYAEEVMRTFATRAYRRPVDDATVERLAELAERVFLQPDKTFEAGIQHAMLGVLASPRFLLRADFPATGASDDQHPLVDEYSLANRLSFFLWSSMPDDELMRLAESGQLRAQLDQQVERMLADRRSEAMIGNFVGQWLRARDVEHVSIDPLAASGLLEEWEALRSQFRRGGGRRGRPQMSPEVRERFQQLREVREMLDGDVRRAMRQETEMMFEYIVREDRSTLELIDSDYTFLNARLADYYGIDGVRGNQMRRVELSPESHRGGILTHGSMLCVTSNPTRTSPVKRGLYILDNLLGTPPPPPPQVVPELEDSFARFGDREPSLRELLAAHREDALCSSCHNRMDPLGLALENFNAMGIWRTDEKGQPIDPSGELITGESFASIEELKKVLTTEHRLSFYRCLTEKMLTYALGRGLDYYDVETVDRIVAALDASGGRMSSLIRGIVESVPFQRIRAGENLRVALSGQKD